MSSNYQSKKFYSTKLNNCYNIKSNPVDILFQLSNNLKKLKFQKLTSEISEKRASVAIIIRVVPLNINQVEDNWSENNTINRFLNQNWVRNGISEILFIRRAVNPTDRWSGDLAFPGGKSNPGESDRQVVERETMEELGIDLDSENYLYLGVLDQREVRTLISNKRLMILCPYVYLQISPATPPMHINVSEIQSIHWVPLSFFMYDNFVNQWKRISYPALKIIPFLRWIHVVERSSNKYYLWRKIEELLLGKIYYGGILLPGGMGYNVSSSSFPCSAKKKPLILWGITLGITSDLVDLLYKTEELPLLSINEIASPKYTHYDMNLFMMLFKNGFPWQKHSNYFQQIPYRKPVITGCVDDENTNIYTIMQLAAYFGITWRVLLACFIYRKIKSFWMKKMITA